MARKSRVITDPKDIDYFLSKDAREMEKLSFMMETFGKFGEKQRFQPYDIITIPAGAYGNEKKHNTKPFRTTLGLWVYNRVFIERELLDVIGYVNTPVVKKTAKKINMKLTYALMEDRISIDVLKHYINLEQKFQAYSNIFCSSFSKKMLLSGTIINKKKKELEKKYAKDLSNPESKAKTVAKIEKELLAFASEYMKDDKAMDMYTSGAKGSFDNNFKNLFVMKGLIRDPDQTKDFMTVDDNYIDGIKKDHYVAMGRSLAEGPYARARRTMVGGYWEKLFLRSFQHVTLGPKDSDCGTNRTITVHITDDNVNSLMYNYIKEGSKLIELTSQNMDKYIGKTVQMRFSSLCESKDHICNKCMGNFFYRLGIKNIGVTTPQVASRLKVISMKSFHNSQVKLHNIDTDKIFEE